KAERLPRLRLNAAADANHRPVEQGPVTLGLDQPDPVFLDREGVEELLDRLTAASHPSAAAMLQEFDPAAVGPGLEPRPETAGFVIDERGHLPGEGDEDVLGNVLGVALLQAPAAAPLVHLLAVAIDKLFPGRLVGGTGLQSLQQAEPGQGALVVR